MKVWIFGFICILLLLMYNVFHQDYGLNERHLQDLKVVCEEASVAGALFVDQTEFKDGRIVFNQQESIKAIEAQIQAMLKLSASLSPTSSSYWIDQIKYQAYFFDDSNTTYPHSFTDTDTGYTTLIKQPTVVVTINAGKARYRLPAFKNANDNIRSSSHVWEGR